MMRRLVDEGSVNACTCRRVKAAELDAPRQSSRLDKLTGIAPLGLPALSALLGAAATYVKGTRAHPFDSLKTPASRTTPLLPIACAPVAPCALPSTAPPSTPLAFATAAEHPGRALSPCHIHQAIARTHSSHGCPQVLSMDVGALSGHLAAHCREPHPRVRLSLCGEPCDASQYAADSSSSI